MFLGKNTRYWHDGQGGNAVDVETTSYALLTQMALQRRGYAGPIVVWLTEQRKGGGGFISTQVAEIYTKFISIIPYVFCFLNSD